MHLVFGRRALLADDMGLGKTVQAIAASAMLKELRGIKQVLVICPASLKHQWEREIRRFTSLSVVVIGGKKSERKKLYTDPAFFKIINYELIRFDDDELSRQRFDLVILDELTYMIAFDYLSEKEILEAIVSRPKNQSVVVTGRGGGSQLQDIMDTVSEVREVKHAYRAGVKARQGVDY